MWGAASVLCLQTRGSSGETLHSNLLFGDAHWMVPTFFTTRLILRELVESDAQSYERHFVDYRVIRMLAAGVPWPYPKGGVLRYIRSEVLPAQGVDRWTWAIALTDEPMDVIGAVDLFRQPSPANRGFWLGYDYWDRGYMTEALEPVTKYAFESLGFETRIFANAAGNARSARIKEKSGARLIGRVAGEYVDPSLTEREIFELTRADWQKAKA